MCKIVLLRGQLNESFGICGNPRNNTTEYVLKEALDNLNKKVSKQSYLVVLEKVLVHVCTVIIVWNMKNTLMKVTWMKSMKNFWNVTV